MGASYPDERLHERVSDVDASSAAMSSAACVATTALMPNLPSATPPRIHSSDACQHLSKTSTQSQALNIGVEHESAVSKLNTLFRKLREPAIWPSECSNHNASEKHEELMIRRILYGKCCKGHHDAEGCAAPSRA